MQDMNIKTPEIRFPEFRGEWVEKRLGECVKIIMGQSPDSQFYNQNKNGLPLIQGANDFEKIHNYTTQITKTCDKNDIIMSVRAPVGALTKAKAKSCIGRGVCAIKGNNFFYYLLLKYQDKLKKFSQGSTFEAINSKDLKSLKIHIPPTLTEQKKIAEFLSSVDEKIEIVDKKIEELKKYKKGLLQKLLNVKKGEPELRFKGFSGKWVEKRLGEVGKIVTGTTPSTKIKSYYENGIYPWVTPTDITENKDIYKTQRLLTEEGIKKGRFIPKNSLLVTCIASIGKNAILRKDGSCNQQINAIIPSQDNNVDFLYYKLETMKNKLLAFAGQTATPILNKTDFSKIKIHIPPTLAEQEKIASFLSSIDEKIELNEKRLKALKKYKQGLLQKMFV